MCCQVCISDVNPKTQGRPIGLGFEKTVQEESGRMMPCYHAKTGSDRPNPTAYGAFEHYAASRTATAWLGRQVGSIVRILPGEQFESGVAFSRAASLQSA